MPKLLTRASFRLFTILDRGGVHVLPKHYYTPVPDYDWLKRNKQVWTRRTSLTGVHWNLDEQLEWLAQTCVPYYHEVRGLEFYEQTVASGVGAGFGAIESQVLHCFIRSKAPRRIVEIGSGVSTACIVNAAKQNRPAANNWPSIVCIEPYPRKAFGKITNIRHLKEPCQTVSASTFDELQAGDLLSVDSSHALRVGSDVIRIYLDIIPRLAPGVYIHIHDIFLPYLYQRSVLFNYFAWQETSLLTALLVNNTHLSVLACLSALHYDRTDKMMELFVDYKPRGGSAGLDESSNPRGHFPASLWLRTC
jgi:Methyltransferase domain